MFEETLVSCIEEIIDYVEKWIKLYLNLKKTRSD